MAPKLLYSIKSAGRSQALSAIPTNLTTLSISWLNKQFKAVAIHRGAIEGTWESPEPIEGTSHFENLIREAAQRTRYRGQSVTLVLAHQRLVHQLVDFPPAKGMTLSKLIQRQASQQKFFVGEAAWAYESSPSNKGNQRVILHLFPRILLNQLMQACRKNNLHLVSVMPPSAVLTQQMIQFPGERDEVELLAAETAGSTSLVIGRNDGKTLLVRTLPGTWNEDPERLALDLNRTILFASQQYGVNVRKEIWVFGPGSKEHAETMQQRLELLVKASPVDDTPYYWATEAAKIRPGSGPNFVSPELQRAPQRRVFAEVVAAGTVLVMIGSLLATGYALWQARQEGATMQSLAAQQVRLEAKERDLRQRVLSLEHQKEVTRLVLDNRPGPVPAWMMAYLSEAVPADLVVTNLVVSHETNSWRVKLSGSGQPAMAQPPIVFSNAVAIFRENLASGPFRVKLLASDDQPGTAAAENPSTSPGAGVVGWLDRLKQSSAAKSSPLNSFTIEGVMR